MADAEAIYTLNRDELGYDYPLEQTKEKLANLLSNKTDKMVRWELRWFDMNDLMNYYETHNESERLFSEKRISLKGLLQPIF